MKEVFTSSTYGGLNRKIEEFMENHDVYDWDNVTIVTEKVADKDDKKDYWWSATLMPKDTAIALKGLLVEEHGCVDVFWTEHDINERVEELHKNGELPSNKLTPEQMGVVKRHLMDTDWEYGLSWYSVDSAIKEAMGVDDNE